MLTKFAKPYEKSHEKNLNCFERYDALFRIKNNFQILVLGTPEGYPALDPFNFIKVDSKFGIMTQSNIHGWKAFFDEQILASRFGGLEQVTKALDFFSTCWVAHAFLSMEPLIPTSVAALPANWD